MILINKEITMFIPWWNYVFYNPYTPYEIDYELVQRIKNWELRVIENKRLWELLECEEKIRKMEIIMKNKQYYNTITSTTD